jgi:radial spoke head protein 4A
LIPTTSVAMDVAAAKALLQRKEGAGSVYDHVTELILKILTDQPANALEAFEKISSSVKAGGYPTPVVGARAGGEASKDEHTAAELARLTAHRNLYKPAASEDGAAGEPTQDLTEEASYLEWAGINFGRTDTFRLHLSLKHLAVKYPVKNLRLWGKLLGKQADYFVAEGALDAEDAEEDSKDALGNTIQKSGEGPNKFTYFVCTAVGESWTKLPNVTPHQIIVARQIRRFLSGNLDAAVGGHPPFPGKEINYVRALVAVISAATVIAPSGAYSPVDGDEDGNIQPNEEEWEAGDLSATE